MCAHRYTYLQMLQARDAAASAIVEGTGAHSLIAMEPTYLQVGGVEAHQLGKFLSELGTLPYNQHDYEHVELTTRHSTHYLRFSLLDDGGLPELAINLPAQPSTQPNLFVESVLGTGHVEDSSWAKSPPMMFAFRRGGAAPILTCQLWGDSSDEAATDHRLLAAGQVELAEEEAELHPGVWEMTLHSKVLFEKVTVHFRWAVCDPVEPIE